MKDREGMGRGAVSEIARRGKWEIGEGVAVGRMASRSLICAHPLENGKLRKGDKG